MLTRNDLINLRNILKRGPKGGYDGMEEAQVAVYLDNKLTKMLSELFLKETDGRNVPPNDQPSAPSSIGG